MSAIACDIHRFPQSNLVMDEGDSVILDLGVTNCGTGGQGNFFYKIVIDGSECAVKYNELLYPGENGEVLHCSITMGSSVINLKQIGGHHNYETGTWDEDFRYEYTISPRTYTLVISPTSHSSPADGDTFNIAVTSNTTWNVNEYKSWLLCTPLSGDGNGTIAVTVDPNTSTSSRIGTVHVTHDGMTRNCVITQAAFIPTLSISPTSHSSPAAGDTFVITVTSNLPWNAYDYETWLSCSPTSGIGNGTTTVTVAANAEASSRTKKVYVTHDGKTRSCTIIQSGIPCNCGDWVSGECVSTTHRAQTRTCTPARCDTEYREIPDSSCAVPLCNQQFCPVDFDSGEYITGANIEVGGAPCIEYPEIERYQINNLTEGLWYNVIASKTGYTCPDDICKDTFEACGAAITLKLKEEPVIKGTLIVTSNPSGAGILLDGNITGDLTPHTYTVNPGTYNVDVFHTIYTSPGSQSVTIAPGATETTHFELVHITCRDYDGTSKSSCESHAGCFWWETDNTCHDTEELTCEYTGYACDGMIDHESVPESATEGSNVTGTVSVDNICWGIGGEETRYRVKYTLDSEPAWYSTDFILGNLGLEDVPFTFLMPDHDVTLTAEVERCNASGKWEPCEDPGHIRTYNITIEEAPECDQGVIITVKDIPTSGLRVQGTSAITWVGATEKHVTPDNPIATFDKSDPWSERPTPGQKWNFRVLNDEDWVLDETKTKVKIPDTGCQPRTLNGYNGCKWYILLTGPHKALINTSFQIKATLKQTPSTPVGIDWNVDFYESSFEGTPIWTGPTDEDGVALCTVPAKPSLGTYTFFAKQSEAPTYCEPLAGLSVEVVEKLEPEGWWEQLIQFIVDTFGVEPEQAKIIAYAGGSLIALLLLSSMFKR